MSTRASRPTKVVASSTQRTSLGWIHNVGYTENWELPAMGWSPLTAADLPANVYSRFRRTADVRRGTLTDRSGSTVAGPKLGSLLSFAGATGANLESRRAGQAAQWSIETGAAVNTYQRPQLRKRMNRFAPIASDDFIIMIPDEMLETKQEDIDGAKKFRGVREIFQCHRAYARQNGGCHREMVAHGGVCYEAKTSCGGPGWLAGCWLE